VEVLRSALVTLNIAKKDKPNVYILCKLKEDGVMIGGNAKIIETLAKTGKCTVVDKEMTEKCVR